MGCAPNSNPSDSPWISTRDPSRRIPTKSILKRRPASRIMPQCPLYEDVWYHIVRYISLEDLDRINSCHHVFYAAWMKNRYATIRLTKQDKEIKRLLAHMCDPNVAIHVKRVEIRPWLVQPRTKSTRSFTENLIVRFLELIDPYYTKKQAEKRLQKRLAKDATLVETAFKQMKNLTEYKIDWDDTLAYHPELYTAFLTPALAGWSSHITKLSLKAPPAFLNSLARVRLPKLEVFVFHFCTGTLSFKDIDSSHDGFVVFLNNLKDSLNSLTFFSTHSSKDLDLSRMYRKFGFFPSLRKIGLSIPFDGSHLSDPMTFVRFLEKHRPTLREIELFSSRCTARNKPGDPEFINWIQRISASVTVPFPQLCSIGVALRPLRAPLDTLVRMIDMHSSTLDSLVLTDRCLSDAELSSLFMPTGSGLPALGLNHLQVKVEALSAGLLAELASLLPNLKTLKVECSEISVNHSRLRNVNIRRQAPSDFSADLIENKDVISSWGLQHLTLGPRERKWAHQISRDLLEHCLPNLKVTDFDS